MNQLDLVIHYRAHESSLVVTYMAAWANKIAAAFSSAAAAQISMKLPFRSS
ncbi:hypothetical protein QMK19_35915 [Streptomyces sp. H10-C2]|uniref:hypothetical protein n=1 Tax=unclassified Streptomyces TaxID=2593676 RepID=UPI0024BBA35F|nr:MULTISPECIES: hypothetical protein [unclassified Streptomyces]MDJ0347593.1 hypothetical protein [Streptomyces sp. PH10-H1]MDJ0374863.1 hypothetical protein [Streptomyces sp. H10-C2]